MLSAYEDKLIYVQLVYLMWTLEVDLVAYGEGTYNPRLRSLGVRCSMVHSHGLLTVSEAVPVKGLSTEASAMKLWTRVTWIYVQRKLLIKRYLCLR